MSRLALAGIVISAAFSTSAAQGHEFWIEPEGYSIEPGENLVAAIRVGQEFDGTSYAYLPQNFRRFEIATGNIVRPVDGRAGDRPAVDMTVEDAGLAILVHVTRDYRLDYSEWQDFVKFVTSKDAEWVIDAHAARDLPQEPPTEAYSRYGKSLIAVGDGAGEDRAFGLLTEIVALENPYTGDVSDGIDVQVFYDGQPRGDAQVEVFAKGADGNVEIEKLMTDKSGIVTVPVVPGHSYLVDAVVLRRAGPDQVESMDATWESLWASLTFAIPE